LAVANYHETYGCFPPAYVADRDGKRMHSWRVLILPFLAQQELYNAYNFDEPWDGPNNRKLADKVGRIYLRSGLESDQVHTTSFVAAVGPETAWKGSEPMTYKDLGDGAHSTLMVVEVPDGTFRWMEPRDLRFDWMSYRINDGSGRGLGSRLGGARVVSADGTVRTLPDDFDPVRLRAMLTANGGEAIDESSDLATAPLNHPGDASDQRKRAGSWRADPERKGRGASMPEIIDQHLPSEAFGVFEIVQITRGALEAEAVAGVEDHWHEVRVLGPTVGEVFDGGFADFGVLV
jgi:hypothetical protein